MALTAQTPDPQPWGRYFPQQQNADYLMVDPSGFIPYSQGQTSAAPIHRSDMPTQFLVGNSYAVTSPQAPQYPAGNHFMFGSYTPPSPPVVPSYKHYQEECPPLRTISTDAGGVQVGYQRDPYRTNPVEPEGKAHIKYEPQIEIKRSPSPSPLIISKTVARNAIEDEASEVIFHTEIDNLMKAIQLKGTKTNEEPSSVEAFYPSPPRQDEEKFNLRRKSCSPEGKSSNTTSGRGGKPRQKRYVCDFKGCGKRCAQKTQLETHMRAHTGEKPYVCKEPGCGLGFSQRGNLKAHIRQHTGEKPFQCDICKKSFAQLGNVKPHRNTHFRTKPFVCMLDGCPKTFSQRGNLKTHHNAYHRETIKRLTQRVRNMTGSEELSAEEQIIFKHFTELYKNLNKGIKGRGPGRKVKLRNPSSTTPSTSQQPHRPQPPPLAQQHSMYQLRCAAPDGLPYQESFGECSSMPRGALPSNMVLPQHQQQQQQQQQQQTAYGQYDIDQSSIASSETATASSSPSMVHEDHYGRAFSTHHRGY
ncbi:uncharacterized protein F4812DRAFT_366961 [Daldinia caldariorum]|uniref:uncharacterized protein n=1 Tax=Daldinia caldariorum TaxID=326644 RepID=UPI002007AF2B|nr:uncharacterized protein F4812DRAFT_366961 [Daldinia caldariorum]KAI1468406.1 hypothetical protein F4812DRAFT_366961 [Daldinia caldariorum]